MFFFFFFFLIAGLPVDASHAIALQESMCIAEILVGLKFHIDYGRRIEIGLILDDELAESTVAEGSYYNFPACSSFSYIFFFFFFFFFFLVTSLSSGANISVMKSDIINELNQQINVLDAALNHASQVQVFISFF